ncbi:hypothetical protein [Aestuariivivens insulae]|uniref:hypothetical protein n=1 Tax=Aestuariivivens insulae TaxID=1621988 RepID=UPI001F5AF5AA|nr:hypothetical protein [Aestuariivivens insulae]
MKLFSTIVLMFFTLQLVVAQTSVNGFEFDFKKFKEITTKWEVYTSNYFVSIDYDTNKKVQVRFKIHSESKKREIFNPNAFYLIIEGEKIKVRPIDLKYNYLHGFVGFGFITPENKNLNPDSYDLFYDYDKEGYENIESKMDFGTKRKPNLQPVYFGNKKFKDRIVDVYFCVPKSLKTADIFYGDSKLAELVFHKFE